MNANFKKKLTGLVSKFFWGSWAESQNCKENNKQSSHFLKSLFENPNVSVIK